MKTTQETLNFVMTNIQITDNLKNYSFNTKMTFQFLKKIMKIKIFFVSQKKKERVKKRRSKKESIFFLICNKNFLPSLCYAIIKV